MSVAAHVVTWPEFFLVAFALIVGGIVTLFMVACIVLLIGLVLFGGSPAESADDAVAGRGVGDG